LRFGATAPGADSGLIPVLCNQLLGTNIKVVSGYQGVAEYVVAFERGEIDGAATLYAALAVARPDWIKQQRIRVLAQFGATRSVALPDVPTAIELAQDEDARDMLRLFAIKFTAAYPMVVPPDVPQERVTALREAFNATMKDPAFLSDLEKMHLPPGAVSGEQVTALIRDAGRVKPELVERLRQMLTTN
jgi:tripartite-type tricarboxylate transporter receptor subunit TctC